MKDRERLIREEAYRIWSGKGFPEGGAEDHWYEAERRVDAGAAGFGEGGAAAPERGEPVRVVAKNAGNSGVVAPGGKAPKRAATEKAAPLKGEAVEVGLAKPRRKTPAAGPKA